MGFSFRNAIALLDRTETDRRRLIEGDGVVAKCALFAAFFGMILILYLPSLLSEAQGWLKLQTDLPLSGPDGWRVLYDAEAATPPSALWESPLLRADSRHEARLVAFGGKEYWLGITLSPETLRRARDSKATRLAAGHIQALYQVWADGELLFEGAGETEPSPLFLPLSAKQLSGARALHVALRIQYDGQGIPPEHYCNGIEPGLYTPESTSGFLTLASFWDRVRPFTLLVSYTLIAALFFFFWLPAPQKQEYFFLAIFGIVAAAKQAQSTDFLRWSQAPSMDSFLSTVYGAWMAGFGLLMALSFARVRGTVLRIGMPLIVLLPPITATLLIRDNAVLTEIKSWIREYGQPLAFALGGLACFVQAASVGRMAHRHARIPVRVIRLALFGAGMIGLGLLYLFQAHDSDRTFWRGFEQFGVILFFSAIALREYGEQEIRIRKSPVSEYHRRPVLPDQVYGAMLLVDLKNSEILYRQRAAEDGEDLVAAWRSHCYTCILRHGGLVLQKKGDEVLAFFPADPSALPWKRAVRASDDIEGDSRLLTEQFRQQGALPAGSSGFFYRGAICEGELKPVWEAVGNRREAYWEEAGHGTPLVEAARLLELERRVPGTNGENSLLILPSALADAAQAPGQQTDPRFGAEKQELADKNGVRRLVLTLKPGANGHDLRERAS